MDNALLIFIAVGSVIHIAGITIMIVMLRDSIRIRRTVEALVDSEEETTHRPFSR